MDDFENYESAIDIVYYSKDVTFNGYVYKLTHLNSMLLNETLTLKVLNICKKC